MFSSVNYLWSQIKQRVEQTKAFYLHTTLREDDGNVDLDEASKEVKRLVKMLSCDEGLSLNQSEDVVSKIGHLAYMGTPESARLAGDCLPMLSSLLQDQHTPNSLREKAVLSLAEICYLHRGNQDRAVSLIPSLADLLNEPESSMSLNRATCYCLLCIVCDNQSALRSLIEIMAQRENKSLYVLLADPWKGWQRNYARLMVDTLGLKQSYSRSRNKSENV